MTPNRTLSIAMIYWTILLAQAWSIFTFGEVLHEHGIESATSSHSADEHKNGQCFSGDLVVHLIAAISGSFYAPLIEQVTDTPTPIALQHRVFGYFAAPNIRDPPVKKFNHQVTTSALELLALG